MSNVPMTRPEEMLAVHKTPYFHSSTFTELDDGRVLHAAGTTFTYSEDGGITWSEPFTRKDSKRNPAGGGCTSLVRLSGKGIGLAAMYRPEQPRTGLTAGYYMRFWRSEDGGDTWEPPVRISPIGIPSHAYQDTLLRTSSGRIILPVYISTGQNSGPEDRTPPSQGKLLRGQWVSTAGHFTDPHFSMIYVCYSDDDGRTWQTNHDGELVILLDWNASYSYCNEPTVAETEPGRLLMLMRTGLGRLFQAWSDDNGETWTRPQPTSLASSTAPAQIRTIPATGHLLVVWNQENEQEIKRGYNRTRLSSAVSRNGGSVWEYFQNIQSMHEETWVEPGPIHPVRPSQYHFHPGMPAPEREAEYCLPVDFHGRWCYPSVFVMKDRVLVAHQHDEYADHPTEAQILMSRAHEGYNQKLKVLPLSWFYGGKKPADHPFLKKMYEIPRGRTAGRGRHDMSIEPK